MRLTKDEARILSEAIEDVKYEWGNKPEGLFHKLTELEDRLGKAGKDKRRIGRTSQDWFSDCLKRFISTPTIRQ
jgi:hypothetical protein